MVAPLRACPFAACSHGGGGLPRCPLVLVDDGLPAGAYLRGGGLPVGACLRCRPPGCACPRGVGGLPGGAHRRRRFSWSVPALRRLPGCACPRRRRSLPMVRADDGFPAGASPRGVGLPPLRCAQRQRLRSYGVLDGGLPRGGAIGGGGLPSWRARGGDGLPSWRARGQQRPHLLWSVVAGLFLSLMWLWFVSQRDRGERWCGGERLEGIRRKGN
jgi:hypothetical protein